ncbi:MAG: HD domain-containing protein [Thermodesulfovibrionales bacterium]
MEHQSSQGKYHKRYYHSVGASYLYKEALKNSNMGPNDYEQQFLRMAALLHDIGHLPFSHLIEDIFNELNWKPAEYKGFYSHVFQTDEKIRILFSKDSEYKKQLNDLGYGVDDLINLINGRYGVGYLDAILNSPLDADKIDYVFRDTYSTNRRIAIPPVQFLKDIVNGLIITPEKYLAFNGISAKALAELLHARSFLYKNLYLQPGILILEGIIKLIIKTYFVHTLKLEDKNILKKINDQGKRFPDLGEYKITFCIEKLHELFDKAIASDCVAETIEKLRKKAPADNFPDSIDNYELKIICLMFKEIEKKERIFNNIFLENIGLGFGKVIKTNSEDDLKELESKIIHWRVEGTKEKKIDELLRDVKFRLPGAAIMEAHRLPKALSTADSRKEKERSDGTKIFSENILVPKENYEIWNPTHKAAIAIHDSSLNSATEESINVYLYPLAGDLDNSHFKQAVNLLEKLFNRNGISARVK